MQKDIELRRKHIHYHDYVALPLINVFCNFSNSWKDNMNFFLNSKTLQLFYMIHLIPIEFNINVFSTISTSHSMTEWRCKYKGQTTFPTCWATGSRMLSMVFVWNTGILNNPESRNTTSYKCSLKTYHLNTSVLPSDRNN